MTHYTHYATSRTLLTVRHRLQTAQTLKNLIQTYTQTHDAVLIHAVPEKIRQAIRNPNYLYAKTGKKTRHFLIDESQDLSTTQWLGIAPLIKQNITRHKSYLVGDAKQAIYRWRGGNPQLLLSQVEKEVERTTTKDLPYNWRSKPVIVHFNNAFFSQAAEKVTQYLRQELPLQVDQILFNEIDEIKKAYAQVTQKLPESLDKNVQGYVSVSFIPSQTRGNEWKNYALQKTIEIVEHLQTQGYQPEGITLLVRNNEEAYTLQHALVEYAKSAKAKRGICYDTLAKTSLRLTENQHIILLLSTLRLIHNPADQVAKATLNHVFAHYVKPFLVAKEGTKEDEMQIHLEQTKKTAL